MTRPTVLVIDDEKNITDILAAVLRDEGYGVLMARDGLEGLRLAREHLPSLIITDLMMPRLDGIRLIAKLRQSPATADIPTILMSCVTRDLSGSGATHFLAKPFDLDVVLDLVESYTSINSAARQNGLSPDGHLADEVAQDLVTVNDVAA